MSKNEPSELEGTGASVEQDQGGHPLFPRPETETGPDPRRFDIIQLQRWLPDGTREVCPKAFRGSELRSWQQVVDMYGGECTYQAAAQCGKTHRFQAYSEKVFFAGPARKPFSEEAKRPPMPSEHFMHPYGVPPWAPPGAPPYPYPFPPPVAPPPSRRGEDLSATLRVVLETSANMQMMMMRAMIDRPQKDPGTSDVSMMREFMTMQMQQQQQMHQLVLQMNEQRSRIAVKQADKSEQMRWMDRGIEIGQKMNEASSGSSEGTSDLAQLMQLAGPILMAKLNQRAQPPVPAPAPEPQPQPPAQPADAAMAGSPSLLAMTPEYALVWFPGSGIFKVMLTELPEVRSTPVAPPAAMPVQPLAPPPPVAPPPPPPPAPPVAPPKPQPPAPVANPAPQAPATRLPIPEGIPAPPWPVPPEQSKNAALNDVPAPSSNVPAEMPMAIDEFLDGIRNMDADEANEMWQSINSDPNTRLLLDRPEYKPVLEGIQAGTISTLEAVTIVAHAMAQKGRQS